MESNFIKYRLVPADQHSATLWLPSSVADSPGKPLSTVFKNEKPRRTNYHAGQNFLTTAGGDRTKAVTYKQMRQLANTYGILRSVIEQRKDEIRGLDWQIGIREEYSKNTDLTDKRREAQKFFEYPDLEHTFDQWIGMLLEDLFVTDTACLFKERDKMGRFRRLEVMDGTTILCLIDDTGRIPGPPQMAYQQIINGIPRTSYMKPVSYDTTNYELHYRPYNMSSYSVYGFSHVESILYIVNIAMRKDRLSLTHFTDSNVPRGFLQTSEQFLNIMAQDPDVYQNIQDMLDNIVAGSPEHQSRLVIVPGVTGAQLLDNSVDFDGTYEEWLARVVCARFGVSPAPYAKMMNRASAMTQEESRQEYALIPMLQHFKSWFDQILATDLNMPYLEFIWDQGASYTKEKASMDMEMLKMGIKTIDDIRSSQGLSPLPDEIGNRHMIWKSSVPRPLEYFIPKDQEATEKKDPIVEVNLLRLKQENLIKSELKAWKKYEMKRLGDSNKRNFETHYIPFSRAEEIRTGLSRCSTKEDIKTVFDCQVTE